MRIVKHTFVFGMFLLLVTLSGCATIPEVQGYRNTQIQGYVVRVKTDFAKTQPKVVKKILRALKEDIHMINSTLPAPTLSALKQTIIWVEPQTPAVADSFSGRGVVYHVSDKWLAEHGFLPEKAQGIQICNAKDYLNWRSHQMALLHEFCHAYHYIIGFDRPDVVDAYKAAKKAKLYERVEYVLAEPGQLKRAYALNNPREYFAELSEAYWGRNDYFPFMREELRKYDPIGYELIEQLWHLSTQEIEQIKAELKTVDD